MGSSNSFHCCISSLLKHMVFLFNNQVSLFKWQFKKCIRGASHKGASYNQWQLTISEMVALFCFIFVTDLEIHWTRGPVGQVHCHLALLRSWKICQFSNSFESWGCGPYILMPWNRAYELLVEMIILMGTPMATPFPGFWGCLDAIVAFPSTLWKLTWFHGNGGFG